MPERFPEIIGRLAGVVDRGTRWLLDYITSALSTAAHPRQLLEQAALALLGYIQAHCVPPRPAMGNDQLQLGDQTLETIGTH